jgi:hypothetical protein
MNKLLLFRFGFLRMMPSLTFVQQQSPPSLLDVLDELKMARATQRSFSSEIIEKRGDFFSSQKTCRA